MQWQHEYDNRGTMQARCEQDGAQLLVTRSPIHVHQLSLEAFGLCVLVTDGKRAIGGGVDLRAFQGNGKPVSANEQAFDAGKQLAKELLLLLA